jgi:hypothetical protein
MSASAHDCSACGNPLVEIDARLTVAWSNALPDPAPIELQIDLPDGRLGILMRQGVPAKGFYCRSCGTAILRPSLPEHLQNPDLGSRDPDW